MCNYVWSAVPVRIHWSAFIVRAHSLYPMSCGLDPDWIYDSIILLLRPDQTRTQVIASFNLCRLVPRLTNQLAMTCVGWR